MREKVGLLRTLPGLLSQEAGGNSRLVQMSPNSKKRGLSAPQNKRAKW